MSPALRTLPTVSLAFINGVRSGLLKESTGVGTVTIKIFTFWRFLKLFVNVRRFASHNSSLVISRVLSSPFFNSLIRISFISNPITSYFFPNSIAKGRPT